jgi:acyl carrier protein
MDVIEREILGIVLEIAELEPGTIEPSTPFAEADVDSFNRVEIAVEVERRFGVRFEERDLREVHTVAQLAELARAQGAVAE